MSAATGEVLARWGWRPDSGLVREAVPTVARGHSLVAVTTPSPAASAPIVAAFTGRLGEGRRGLVVVPEAELALWGGMVQAVASANGIHAETAYGVPRATRRLRGDGLELLVATPAAVLALLERSALKADALDAVLLARPETYAAHAALAPLMQDLPKEAQRVVLTADAEAVADLVERYARKALVVGAPPLEAPPAPPAGPVRAAHAAWQQRAAALADLVALLDPATVTVWAADLSDADAIARAVPLDGDAIRLVTGAPVPSDLIVAWDLPTPAKLAELVEAGETVLLVPPGAEAYVQRIARPVRPLALPGLADVLAREAGAQRAAVLEELERGVVEPAILALAPLFERYDAVRVAAALYELWRRGGAAPARPAVPASAARAAEPAAAAAAAAGGDLNAKTGPTAKIFVTIGRKDGVTPADIVGALTRELHLDRTWIGRIELRDAFSLVEVPAPEAERIAQRLTGVTIRRVRVTARLDRGSPAGPRGAAAPGGRPARAPRR